GQRQTRIRRYLGYIFSSLLGATLAPLALVSVGYQLRFADLAGRIPALTLGLLFKLVFGPILITLILVLKRLWRHRLAPQSSPWSTSSILRSLHSWLALVSPCRS